MLPYKLALWTPGSLPQIVQWSMAYVLFNFCTLVLNHTVERARERERERERERGRERVRETFGV